MRPGVACNNCHDFGLSGTVYPTPHEPDRCKGANVSGAKIVITDAANKTYSLSVNSAGNFYGSGSLTYPIHVKLTANGKERAMTAAITSSMGDCNSCHTQNGAGSPKAPGRILVPK